MEVLLDADVLYAYFNPSDWLHKYAKEFFVKTRNVYRYKTSVVVILELAIVFKRDLPKLYTKLIEKIKELNIEILSINRDITEHAFNFMEKGLGIFDAFHAATAKYYNLPIVSTDKKYSEVGVVRLDFRNI